MARSHRIDIGGLLAGSRQRLLLDDQVPIEAFEGVAFPEPARVHLEIRSADGMLAIQGSIEARAHGPCDGCLVEVDRDIRIDVEERLDPAVGCERDPFGEGNVLHGDRLDVGDLAQQLVLSALPMGLRCKDDCAGLCGVCAADKNAGTCSCDEGGTTWQI